MIALTTTMRRRARMSRWLEVQGLLTSTSALSPPAHSPSGLVGDGVSHPARGMTRAVLAAP